MMITLSIYIIVNALWFMISIIGAGPCGSHTAYLLAKAGLEVSVFEEHKSIGEPMQCTGIVTPALEKIIELKKNFVVNTINKTRIYAPNNSFVDIELKRNIILDRKKFDAHLAKEAKKQGAKFFLNHKFISFKKRDGKTVIEVKNNKTGNFKKFKTRVLIGADGPVSSVAKAAGMFGERKFFVGLQNVMEENNDNIVEFYPLKQGIGWVVPESKNRVRAGMAVRENIRNSYASFMEKRFGKDYMKKVKSQQAGLVPEYNPKLITQKQNIFIVGDAATQVKATTLGGLVPGLIASQELVKSIIKYDNYERNWKKAIGKELWLHLKIRKMLDSFSDNDYNRLVNICDNENVKKTLRSHDRDFPSKFLLKMLLAEPRLIYFGKYFHRLF